MSGRIGRCIIDALEAKEYADLIVEKISEIDGLDAEKATAMRIDLNEVDE